MNKKRVTKRERSEFIWGWLFIAPTMIGLIILNIIPIFQTIYQSFFKTGDFGKGNIFVGEQKVKQGELVKKITAIVLENPKIQMMISGDKKADYGSVIEVMALLRSAGFTQVGLKTDAEVMKEKG